jgi:hypothetical protein
MPPASPQSASLREHLLREAVEMIRYAFSSGKSVPTSVVDTVEQYESHPQDAPPLDPSPLVLAHSRLAKIVAPATPRAVVILADEYASRGRFSFLGPVPLVRQLMTTAIVCVVAFLALSLTKATNSDGTPITIFTADGTKLLVNEVFWLAAAGIGASFAMLFQVNEYIAKCNYDPKHAPTYWIKFFLGVMAGYILVTLLPIPEGGGTGLQLTQPTVAMLGGYSASAVYRILTRLVEAVEAIFRGNAKELIAEREQAAAARASEEASRSRVRLAARLVDVQRQISTGAAADEVTATIRDIVASLTPEVAEVEQLPASVPQAQPSAAVTVAATPEALVAAAGRAKAEEPAEAEAVG